MWRGGGRDRRTGRTRRGRRGSNPGIGRKFARGRGRPPSLGSHAIGFGVETGRSRGGRPGSRVATRRSGAASAVLRPRPPDPGEPSSERRSRPKKSRPHWRNSRRSEEAGPVRYSEENRGVDCVITSTSPRPRRTCDRSQRPHRSAGSCGGRRRRWMRHVRREPRGAPGAGVVRAPPGAIRARGRGGRRGAGRRGVQGRGEEESGTGGGGGSRSGADRGVDTRNRCDQGGDSGAGVRSSGE